MNWGYSSWKSVSSVIFAFLIISSIVFTKACDAGEPVLATQNASSGDEWFGKDKFYHFTVSAVLSFSSFYIYRDGFNNDEDGSYYFGGGFSVSVGIFKEYYDSKHPESHHASWKDFAADVAGAGFGLLTAYFILN